MSFIEAKRQAIKNYILSKIYEDDPEFIAKSMDAAGVSITTIKNYIKDELKLGHIEINKEQVCGYSLTSQTYDYTFELKNFYSEDHIFNLIENNTPLLYSNMNENAIHIFNYTLLEMLNNVFEHSNASQVKIYIQKNILSTKVIIIDNGIGIFKNINTYNGNSELKDFYVENILFELYKGKFTTKPDNHSGEGIFFSSKLTDSFGIISDSYEFYADHSSRSMLKHDRLIAYLTNINNIGTLLTMNINHDTNKNTEDVFNSFSDEEGSFTKTYIPIIEACGPHGPLSRSQGRRITNRLEDFKEVILDFDEVSFMGQGFADEVFRVYALNNKNLILRPINACQTILKMIKHVSREAIAENIVFEDVY